MKKKLVFDFEPSDDNQLIGLSCHLKDYRLSFYLNRSLGFQFKKIDNLKIQNGKVNNGKKFSLFYYDYTENHVQFFLIENRNANGILINEFKQFDYFIVINGVLNTEKISVLIKDIRSSNGILMVNQINVNSIKKIKSILSDLELHIMELKIKEKEKSKLKAKASRKEISS